jgi:hypothetical protein
MLLGLLVCMPLISVGFAVAAKALDLPDKVFMGGASVAALAIVALTALAHKLREAAVADNGKSYWANLL